MPQNIRIFIIAGEASGDLLGGSLMRSLKDMRPDVEFYGIGGASMQREGLQSLFPMEELSVMGITEILPRLPRILSRLSQTVRAVLDCKPDALVTIDSPDFCFRVVKKVRAKSKDRKIPCIHYVAPSVWAWRPGRAKKVAGFLDHLLTLLPFEPPYFEAHGLRATFVGHPLVEKEPGNGEKFMEDHGLEPDQPVLCMLPGSRMSELDRLLDTFCETADIVLQDTPDTAIIIPTLPHLKPHIEKFFVGRGINPVVIDKTVDKYGCFAASTVAVAASGTVSLELALHSTPHIIAYKLGTISAWLAKRLVKTPYVNLVNIILNRPVVPEMLLEDCEAKPMAKAVLKLMDERRAREAQLSAFREALAQIGLGAPETPGQKAAKAVLDVIGAGGGTGESTGDAPDKAAA